MHTGPSDNPVLPCDAAVPDPTVSRTIAATSLLDNVALELTSNGKAVIEEGARILPPGTKVYVPKVPRESFQDKLRQIRLLKNARIQAVPHIVARQLSSAAELCDFVGAAVADSGVKRVLVIGGDADNVAGPFNDAADVIASGILEDAGIREIDVAGYPDGHPKIPKDVILNDLRAKVTFAQERSLALGIVTQFSFSADAIAWYCDMLHKEGIVTPVYAGLAGPTSPAQLLRFAAICGVSTSIRAANKLGLNALKLAANTTPDKHLDALAAHHRRGDTGNLAGIHIFSFGGFVKSAGWLTEKIS